MELGLYSRIGTCAKRIQTRVEGRETKKEATQGSVGKNRASDSCQRQRTLQSCKVAAHQSKTQKVENSVAEKVKRAMDEAADKLSGEGAKKHRPPVIMPLEKVGKGPGGSHDPKDDFSDLGKKR